MTDIQVVDLWRERICQRAQEVDPGDEHRWETLWVGFVIALGRDDLATYTKYRALGFPVVMAVARG